MNNRASGVATTWWREALLILVMGALVFGPISFSPDAKAAEHHSQFSDHRHSGSDGHSGKDSDHGIAQCGPFSCSPSFTVIFSPATIHVTRSLLVDRFPIEDRWLCALYLGGDPPVPRSGFSLT